MLEPVVTDAPRFFPWKCSQCDGQTGPLVDTHVELPGGLRLYLCASCIRLDGLALGLIRGKKHSELLAAARHGSETEAELERVNAERGELLTQLQAEQSTVSGLRETVDWQWQRIAQLEAAVSEDAKAKLAIVGETG